MKKKLSSEYIKESAKEYAIYVCENRAIPRASDGLKDSHRKFLWLIRNKADKIKTISLAGLGIQEGLYVHGDASASDAISKLAAPYLNNIPLLEGIGAFGSRTAPVSGIGAPRYTYVKRNNATQKLLLQDLDVVPLKENYDGSTLEPETFLPIVPIVLLNSISGIAVGWSTEILPRNLNDIIRATSAAIDGKRFKKLTPSYDYLDVDVEHVDGNTWEFVGKYESIDSSTIRVTELPPDLSLDKFKNRLMQLEDNGTIKDWTDRSTSKINIEIKFKRGELKKWTDEKIINTLKLKTKKTERIVVINWDGDAIKQYDTAEELVRDFVEWRFKYYIKRYKKYLEDTQYDLKFWQAVKLCFDNDLPSKLIKLKNKNEIEKKITSITKSINIDSQQLERIVSTPTYNWSEERYYYVLERIQHLKNKEKEYQDLLNDHSKIRMIFKNEVDALKKEKFNV